MEKAVPTVLLVGGDRGVARERADALTNAGFQVVRSSPDEVLTVGATKRPHVVVVSDCGAKAADVCNKIKAAVQDSPPLVLCLSADGSLPTEAFDGHLMEPVTSPILVANVRTLVRLAVAEAALRQGRIASDERDSEERYRRLFDHMSEGFFLAEMIQDDQGRPINYRFLDANPALEQLTGLRRDAIIGKTVREVLAVVQAEWLTTFGRVAANGEPARLQTFATALGRHYDAVVYSPRRGQFACLFNDVTKRRSDEEALRLSEQRHRRLFESGLVGVVYWKTDGGITDANDKFLEMVGYSRDDLRAGRVNWAKMTPPEYRRLDDRAMEEVKDTGVDTPYEKEFIRKDGSRVPVLVGAAMLDERRDQGVAFVLDIRLRKRAQEALRESEEQFQVLTRNLFSAVALIDEQGAFSLVNPAFRHLFDIPDDADILNVNSRDWRQWQVFDEQGVLLEVNDHPVRKAALTRTAVRNQLVGVKSPSSSQLKWLLVSAEPILDAQGGLQRLVATYYDITDRKRTEEALQVSQRRYAAIHDHSPFPIALIKLPEGTIAEVNEAWEQFFECPRAQAIGRTSNELGLASDVEARQQMYVEIQSKGGVRNWEMSYRTRSGKERVASFSFDRVEIDGQVYHLGTAMDITDRKRAEEELKAATLAAQEASRAKDHFLAVLSHELRTPLAPVVTGLAMLQAKPGLDVGVRESLAMIRRNIELEARLIDDLLDVTRISRGKTELDRKPVELCEIIRRAVEVCKPDIEARQLEFGVDPGDASYIVEADATRLQQVFWNLLRNAIKFTSKGGCVGIRCRRDGDGHVVADVNDSGEGIEREALSSIFNAFEQAERSITRQFGGLGLGLTISKALVELHDGTIEAYSEGKGKGATFRVRLPLAASTPVAEPPRSIARPATRRLRILLVEDHGDTAEMMEQVLMLDGHEVQRAGDVATALDVVTKATFDLLISDLGLPDRSGLDLMRELRARGHMMPGIALSGYGQEEDVHRCKEAGFAAHLTKPASPDRLCDAIAVTVAKSQG